MLHGITNPHRLGRRSSSRRVARWPGRRERARERQRENFPTLIITPPSDNLTSLSFYEGNRPADASTGAGGAAGGPQSQGGRADGARGQAPYLSM